ncbi:hypothetical protein ABWH97_13895 [Nitratireductor sp. ac15]
MGGKNTTTKTSSNKPYEAAEPLLKQGMGDALKQYKNGGLVKPNTMSTVVPFSQQTTQSMNDIQNRAAANMGGKGLSGQYQNIINSGGYNAPQKTAMAGWNDTATGAFDLQANPAYQSVLRQATDAASNAVNSQAAAMGRYGSAVHQGNLAREVGDLTARMGYNEYNNWQDRRDTARNNLFNAGQTGIGNLGEAFQGSLAPADAMAGVGSMYEDLMGRQMNDRLRIANEQQNLPLANIQALLAAAAGAGDYKSQTTSSQMPNSTASNIMGGLLGGASLLSGGKVF